MAQVQHMGTGWIPVRHLLCLTGHLHMLRDQGKDGSKQLPRGYYRRKAHEKKVRHTERFAGGKGNHFRQRKTKPIPTGGLWTKAHENPVTFQKTSRYAMGEALPAHRVQKELPNGQTSFSLCCVFWRQQERSGWNVRPTSSQQQKNSSPEEDANNGSLQQNCRFCLKSLASCPFFKKDAQQWTKGWSLHLLHGNFYNEK